MSRLSGPAEVKGKYESIRNWLQPILIFIFIITPWLRLKQQPILLLNFFDRKFFIFGYSFFSHDAPLLFFLLILMVLSIFIVTAVFGRLWCGWSCPQTVFLNAVFNRVEKLILGSYSRRQILIKSDDSFSKKIRFTFLYTLYFGIAWLLAHSFAAYFISAESVTRYITDGPLAHMQSFSILVVSTCALFFNFAFFRERLCIYICPYGRFQNALIDSNTLVVSYDSVRGEPRHKLSNTVVAERGDCVDCKRCVSVCPVKIDIRNGFQFDCIACGKCIDACNDVMTKIKKSAYLIRYETGDKKKITLKRFRLLLYAGLLLIFGTAFALSLYKRNDVDFNVFRSSGASFSNRFDGQKKILQNRIQLHLKNQTSRVLNFEIELTESNLKKGYTLIVPIAHFIIQPEQDLKVPAFIEIESKNFISDTNSKIEIVLKTEDETVMRSMSFIGVE